MQNKTGTKKKSDHFMKHARVMMHLGKAQMIRSTES